MIPIRLPALLTPANLAVLTHDLDRVLLTPARWWLLRRLPRAVVYWVALRAIVEGTRSDETVSAVPAMDVVARWGTGPGRAAAWGRTHAVSPIVADFDIRALIEDIRDAGHNDWADRVDALLRDYVASMRDVASVFHVDAMPEVRRRVDDADQGHGAPLSVFTSALYDLVGPNSLGDHTQMTVRVR